jgi:erythromycin esterase-like protein
MFLNLPGPSLTRCLMTLAVFAGVYGPDAPQAELPSIVERVTQTVCDARVVLLGELPNHGVALTFDVKSRIVDRLIARCGFSAVLFEAPVYDFIGFERAVASRTATPIQLDNAIGRFWTTRELTVWRRSLFEAATAHRLLLGGLDDQFSATSNYARATLPGLIAKSSSTRTATACAEAVARHLNWRYDTEHPFDDRERRRLHECGREAADAVRTVKSPPASDSVAIENFARYAKRQWLPSSADRDASMYQNVLWYLRRAPRAGKVVVWTATVHAARAKSDRPQLPLGALLVERIRNGVAAVGFTALAGETSMAGQPAIPLLEAAPDSLESQALRGASWAFVDAAALRTFGPISSRLLGKTMRADWSDYFDAVVVIKEEVPPTFEPR